MAWTVNHSNPFVDIDVRSYFFSPDGKGMPVLMRGLVWRGHAASGPETTSSNAFAALFYRGEPSGRVRRVTLISNSSSSRLSASLVGMSIHLLKRSMKRCTRPWAKQCKNVWSLDLSVCSFNGLINMERIRVPPSLTDMQCLAECNSNTYIYLYIYNSRGGSARTRKLIIYIYM